MKLVDHPNIVKLYEFFEDSDNFYLVTELCSGGPLFDEIIKKESFSENEAANIMQQLLSAIAHCHLRKIVHRDVKPENLLIDVNEKDSTKYNVKIIDFGISCSFDPK
jgi:calcium-dependent protein kinase